MECTDVMHKCWNFSSERSKFLSLSEDSLPHAHYNTFLAHSRQIQKAALLAITRDDFWEKGLN